MFYSSWSLIPEGLWLLDLVCFSSESHLKKCGHQTFLIYSKGYIMKLPQQNKLISQPADRGCTELIWVMKIHKHKSAL